MSEKHPPISSANKQNGIYQVVIVDDEQLARKLLSEYISKINYLQLAGSCTNAIDTLAIMQKQKVDILLTDIQMPDISGLDLVASMASVPAIIFTTAYSEYAIDGYELNAADYLLKPIAFPRFLQAINKAVARVNAQKAIYEMQSATAEFPNGKRLPDKEYIVIKADFKLYKIKYEDLLYIEGQHEYVTFHTTQRNITAYYSLKHLVEILPANRFIRIHKSYIVAIKYVDIIDGNFVQIGALKLPVGTNFKEAVKKIFEL